MTLAEQLAKAAFEAGYYGKWRFITEKRRQLVITAVSQVLREHDPSLAPPPEPEPIPPDDTPDPSST